jgi:hypothetical protein
MMRFPTPASVATLPDHSSSELLFVQFAFSILHFSFYIFSCFFVFALAVRESTAGILPPSGTNRWGADSGG